MVQEFLLELSVLFQELQGLQEIRVPYLARVHGQVQSLAGFVLLGVSDPVVVWAVVGVVLVGLLLMDLLLVLQVVLFLVVSKAELFLVLVPAVLVQQVLVLLALFLLCWVLFQESLLELPVLFQELQGLREFRVPYLALFCPVLVS